MRDLSWSDPNSCESSRHWSWRARSRFPRSGWRPSCPIARRNSPGNSYEKHDRAFEIWEVSGGYQIRTRAEFSGYLQQLQAQRPLRLSRAALETLSIVAYKQPATRAEVEEVRGVESGAVLRTLLDRRLVRLAGHRDVPGRPMLYATTPRFLEVFGLESVKDLPRLRELDELAREQGIEDGPEETDAEASSDETDGNPSPEATETDSSGEVSPEVQR